MTQKEYETHEEDYNTKQLSSGAFVLFLRQYILTLKAQLRDKDEQIERLKAELEYYKEHSKSNATIGDLFLDL